MGESIAPRRTGTIARRSRVERRSVFHAQQRAANRFGALAQPLQPETRIADGRRIETVLMRYTGRVINPLGAESQIEGGIIQGIGHTLSEIRLDDPRTGRVLTTGLDAYKLPTIADVPEIVSELVDVPDPHLTNLGSKGLGEPPIVPVAAAIANAIRDATGAQVRSLPISREEMLRALHEAEERAQEQGKRGAPAGV